MTTERTHKKARYDPHYTHPSPQSHHAIPFPQSLTNSFPPSPPPGAALMHKKDPMSYFPEEIATHIFAALNPADLGKCATVSKLWHRLVNDQILWQQLFIKYGFISPRGLTISSGHLSSSSSVGHTTTSLSRKRKRTTPQRQLQRQYQLTSPNQCWKALYRLNYNWTVGQATVATLSLNDLWMLDQDVLLRQSLSDLGRGSSDSEEMQGTIPRIPVPEDGASRIVRFRGQVILVASPQGMVHLWRIRDEQGPDVGAQERKPEYWQTYTCPRIPDGGCSAPPRITCLALDTSSDKSDAKDWQRVLVGYESGHFSIFQYYQGQPPLEENFPTMVEIGATTQLVAWSEVGAVQSACFRYPIMTTCSQEDGAISIYRIQEKEHGANGDPQHWCRLLHRLYGTPTQSPVEMELSQISSAGSEVSTEVGQASGSGRRLGVWRILASFGLELFDNSWTVRVQEIEFDDLRILLSKETGAEGESTTTSMDPTLAFQEPSESSFWCPEPMVDHPRIGAISALSVSWPYVVTTHSDNTLNVFQMYRVATGRGGQGSGSSAQSKGTKLRPRLAFQHMSTLYGHCGAVSSVSIEPGSGRLVSASMDRSIKIWTLMTASKRAGDARRLGSSSSVSRYQQHLQRRQYQCSVSMSDINKSWTKAGQVTMEEGQGLVWIGADEEKVVSMSYDGSIKVWQFS
ncbi:hypothetical protein CPC16_007340 [Podila verticillata]|nr:hypothetical protein CPC16_007340 [Podila verticillata]